MAPEARGDDADVDVLHRGEFGVSARAGEGTGFDPVCVDATWAREPREERRHRLREQRLLVRHAGRVVDLVVADLRGVQDGDLSPEVLVAGISVALARARTERKKHRECEPERDVSLSTTHVEAAYREMSRRRRVAR